GGKEWRVAGIGVAVDWAGGRGLGAKGPQPVPRPSRGEDFSPSSSQPPYVVVGGIDLLGRCSPWKVPLAPLTIRSFRCLRCPLGTGMTGRGDLGNAPLRRTSTLTHMCRQATTKRQFEQLQMQFSARCCRKNTCLNGPFIRERKPL